MPPLGKALLDAATAANVSMDTWTHEVAERLLPTSAAKEFPALPNFLLPNVAGSLMTTANDYGRFLVRLMADDTTLRVMLTPTTRINRVIQWALGVGLQTEASGTTFWHWGDTFGFKNVFVADPATKSAVAVFTNGQTGARCTSGSCARREGTSRRSSGSDGYARPCVMDRIRDTLT